MKTNAILGRTDQILDKNGKTLDKILNISKNTDTDTRITKTLYVDTDISEGRLLDIFSVYTYDGTNIATDKETIKRVIKEAYRDGYSIIFTVSNDVIYPVYVVDDGLYFNNIDGEPVDDVSSCSITFCLFYEGQTISIVF